MKAIALAEECRLQERIEAMFRGDKINFTEGRAALHTALRIPREASVIVLLDGAAEVEPQESLLVRRQFRLGEQRASGIELLIVELKERGAPDLAGAGLCEDLYPAEARALVLG